MRKAEEKGQDSSAFKEALSVIGRNYDVSDEQERLDIYADISRSINETRGCNESPGYIKAVCDPKYRVGTAMCIMLGLAN